jgi:hypothetical protein
VFLINLEGNDMKTCGQCGGAILTGVNGWGGKICYCKEPYPSKTIDVITLPIAEYEAMRLDAERYKWFKENAGMYGNQEGKPIVLFNSHWFGGHFNNINDLDEAIDSAIKEGN